MTDTQNSGAVDPVVTGQPTGHPTGSETLNGRSFVTLDRKIPSLLSSDERQEMEAWRALEQQDKANADAGREKFEAEFGEEAQSILNVARSYLGTLGEDTREKLEKRTATGNTLLNDPEVIANLAVKATENIPPLRVAVIEYGSERAALEAMMADRYGPYWKGPHSEALQLRYRMLLRG